MTTACFEVLPFDTEFFGLRIARVQPLRVDRALLDGIVAGARADGVGCLYFLADPAHRPSIAAAEGAGFSWVDARTTLQLRLPNAPAEGSPAPLPEVTFRDASPEDVPILRDIASRSHEGTRFFFDPRFGVDRARALYALWIEKSCAGYADLVIVADASGEPAGYLTAHLDTEFGRARIGLVGVDHRHQGRGLGKRLVEMALDRVRLRGVSTITVVTQGRNVAAQRLYQAAGFRTLAFELWYHLWIDP